MNLIPTVTRLWKGYGVGAALLPTAITESLINFNSHHMFNKNVKPPVQNWRLKTGNGST